MDCSKCGEDIGEPGPDQDRYDLLKSHIENCSSEEAKKYREARNREETRSPGQRPRRVQGREPI